MAGEADLDSGTAVEGGVGNGQATGTGQVSDSFDMDSAVNSISDGLGFGETVNEEVVEPAGKAVTTAPAPSVPVKPAVDPAAPAVPAVAATDVAPKTWKAEEAAVWAAIPPAAKAAIARREEDMFRGIEQHKATAAFGSRVQSALDPYMPILKAHNVDPVDNINNLMRAHYVLATGTMAQKQQMMQGLITDYKVQMGEAQEPDPYAPVVDPLVQQLQQKIQVLESGQAQQQQEVFRQEQIKTTNAVNAFAENPANVHFAEVAEDMAKMLGLDKELTLEAAYERAIWGNPVTRAKEIARQDAEKQAKQREDAAKQVSGARRAVAANVQVQPKAGAATLPLGTMDDTMAETMASIKNRS